MTQISIVVPLFNEEKNLNLLHERLTNVLTDMGKSFELVFVNDGSKDATLERVKLLAEDDPKVKYINFSRNFGHQVAVSAGLDMAVGQAVVIIDADLQDPPELIPLLYEKYKQGYEVVYAKRRQRKGESWMKLWTAKMFYRLLASLSSVEIPLDTGDFRIIDRKVVEVLKAMPEKNKFLRGQISWAGFRQTFVEYDRSERAHGNTGYTYAKMIRFALDGITSFSDFPLKLASMMGFFVSGVSFLVMIFALYARLVTNTYVPGWASTITAVLFLGGIQLIAIGIIGEYISRMSANVKNRPLYIIEDTNILTQNMH